MKAVLYLSLTANGYVAQPDESHPVPKEILGNFVQLIGKIGNLINGRRTYELMHEQTAHGGFHGIELVVVSHSLPQADGIHVATSPLEALHYLEQKGFDTALLGGGAQLDSSFLSQGLIDEIYLNIEPIICNKGIALALNERFEASLEIINWTKLSENIVQLHYRMKK